MHTSSGAIRTGEQKHKLMDHINVCNQRLHCSGNIFFLKPKKVNARRALAQCGGWNANDRMLSPIHVPALSRMPHTPALEWVTDSMAEAAEAGGSMVPTISSSSFYGGEGVRAFRMQFREEGADIWVNDCHHNAMRKLEST